MNATEFAATIRKKYPGSYDNVDDVTLAKKVVEKYPVYADKVTFEAAEPVKEKGFMRKTAEAIVDSPALPIAGGVVGGIVGIPLGPGAIGAAAIGGAGGEAWRQNAARALGMDAPDTSLEAAKEIGIEGLIQGAGQAFGMGAGKTAGLAMKAPIVKGAVEGVKKTAGDVFQILTKMHPKDAATLFKNPKAILPGQWPKAQKAWREAAEEIGIPIDDVSPEMIKVLKGDAQKTVFETYERMAAGEAVSAAEAQTAKQAIDVALMPAAKTVRKNPLVALYSKMRGEFVERIGKESPKMAAANKQYGIAATGKKFRSLFPRNQTGDPAYFRSSVLPSLLTGAGAMRGDPLEGAIQGAAVAGASSPLAIGSLIALAGGARGLAPYASKTLTATLAELAGDRFKRK